MARGMGAEIAHHHGVAVGRRLGDAGRADGAAGAGDVLDDDLGAERRAHLLGEDAREHVGRPAGGERHDHRDRTRRDKAAGPARREPRARRRARLRWRQGSNAIASMSPFRLEGYARGRPRASFRRDREVAGQAGVFVVIILHQLRELSGAAADRLLRRLQEVRPHRGLGERLVDLAIEARRRSASACRPARTCRAIAR